MNEEYTIQSTQYFTATIHEWQAIPGDDMHKDIIMESLQYLVNDKRIELNAFVIMSNHIHLTCLPQASLASLNRLYIFKCSGIVYEI